MSTVDENNEFHSYNDQPAAIWVDGSKHWYLNGKKHRINGPAVILANGTRYWFQDDRLHREDGPAIILQNGKMEFYCNGKRIKKLDVIDAKKSGVRSVIGLDD